MSGILAAAQYSVLRAMFGDNHGTTIPSSFVADLYDGDPANGGAKVPEAPSVTIANTTANFTDDPEDSAGLLFTVSWGTSAGPWSTDGVYVVLSSGGTPWYAFPLAMDDEVVVAQAGVVSSSTPSIHFADVSDLAGVDA